MLATYCNHRFRQNRRAGTSLIELTIVVIIMAIGAAVVAPKWVQSLDRTRVAAMKHQVEADVAALRRWSVRRGKTVQLTYTVGTSRLTISPAAPQLLGAANGVVDYSKSYPGSVFSAVNLGGSNTATLNIYGEFVSTATGTPLTNALITLTGPSSAQSIDLLVQEGTVSPAASSPLNP